MWDIWHMPSIVWKKVAITSLNDPIEFYCLGSYNYHK